jgi:AraC family transcriptional regulator of adaptative response/methylated-DNA-[protein]-cysteine methyltransferase
MLNEEQCWQAVIERDRTQDGKFLLGVLTTGIYCRPSCPARKPLRQNVRFYETPAAAERDGLRACLRCRPLASLDTDPDAERMQALCAYIRAHVSEGVTLAELGRKAGLSPFHVQRRFKAIVGMTPKQYLQACRLETFKGELRSRRSVTEAIYEAGFGASSSVYGRVDARLGMTPAAYRAGGTNEVISYQAVDCPLGRMLVGATERGLCFVQFGDDDDALLAELRREYPAATTVPMPVGRSQQAGTEAGEWIQALQRHLKGQQPHLDLPLDVRATAFQMKVWQYLQSIPYGEVQSYSEVAEGIGQPTAVRAVARACATNRVAVVIPCHRVVRGSGELGGYRGGPARKKALLEREKASRRS